MSQPDPQPQPSPPTALPGVTARRVMRSVDRAYLGTTMRPDAPGAGQPYTSLVLVALDHDASPILLVSTLADHTKNMLASPAVSVLFDGTQGHDEPLTGPRVTVQGIARQSADPQHAARYVARHPSAAMYSGFNDFAFWRMEITRAHLVAGFGRIHWIEPGDVAYDASDATALRDAEAEIVAHLNGEHADAVQLYAVKLLGRTGGDWILTGVDPEGADLRRGGEVARLSFDKPVHDAEQARTELVRLVKRARQG